MDASPWQNRETDAVSHFCRVGPACTWLFDKGAVGVISVGPAAEMNKLSQQERIDLAKAAATHFGAKCRTVCFADVSSKGALGVQRNSFVFIGF